MSSSIFLLQNEESLIELQVKDFLKEERLQQLLARYPHLIPASIDPDDPRRWMLVAREVAIADGPDAGGRWSLDHLFLDQSGIPTLVEVKRSKDTRLRREVVGQMLDYAANALAHWKPASLRQLFESRCQKNGLDPQKEVAHLTQGVSDYATFWAMVDKNFADNHLRLIFVAERIPPELRRIIEFMNQNMETIDVFGLEIAQYQGEGQTTLVPSLVGQTLASEQRKAAARPKKQWDRPQFLAAVEERCKPADADVARQLLDWAESRSEATVWWGQGALHGNFYLQLGSGKKVIYPFAVSTHGRLSILFDSLARSHAFASDSARRALLERLNALGLVGLGDVSAGSPSLQLSTLAEHGQVSALIKVFDDILQQLTSTAPPPTD